MRKNIVAGNWKMNTTVPEGKQLAEDVKKSIQGKTLECEVILGVPATHIYVVAEAVKGSAVKVAGENSADHKSGAYTGELSPAMVRTAGATHVILGHSERRAYYHETPEILKTKVDLSLEEGLTPIFCIGENLDEREANKHFQVVEEQIEKSLFHLDAEAFSKLILAYEPVWAIGTGKTATAEQAQEIHAHIRSFVEKKYGANIANDLTILYGGSCNGGNAKDLFAKPDVDGGLIGGASLSAEKFLPIIEAFDK